MEEIRSNTVTSGDKGAMLLVAVALVISVFSSGCHLPALMGTSGALIGGAVANRPGAMIGGGAGMLAGAVAEVLLYPEHPSSSYSPCDSFSTVDEQHACLKGHVQAEEENRSDRIYRAERYGYDQYRKPYRN